MKTLLKLLFCCGWLLALPAFAASSLPAEKPFTETYIGETRQHTTAYEDTLVKIARDNNLGFNELRAANPGIDPWVPGAGVKLILPTMHLLPQGPHKGIVINLPEQRVYYYKDAITPPITHPIGVGREGLSTPTGTTKVVRKVVGPVWRPTARMRAEDPNLPVSIGPGADNPMGTHALYLGWPQYAIHGTNKPYGIGRRVSSGCIRLYPEDIVSMYDIIPVGTPVTVLDQPIKVSWVGNDLYLEAHPSMAQADDVEQNGRVSSYEFSKDDMALLMETAGEYIGQINWPLVRQLVRQRHGIPVVVATKPADGTANDPKS